MNSTGSVAIWNTKIAENRVTPASASDGSPSKRPIKNNGIDSVEPMFAAGIIAFRILIGK